MLLLFSNPGSGLSLALEAGISAGESADLIDVDRERAVRFVDDPVISQAFKYGMRSGVRKPAEGPDRELLPDRHRNWPDCDRRRPFGIAAS